jgi:hypothetical protein
MAPSSHGCARALGIGSARLAPGGGVGEADPMSLPHAPRPRPEDDPPRPASWTIPRIAAVVAALAIALFWLWIFSGAPAKDNPDRLTDEAYVSRLEARCQQLRATSASCPGRAGDPDRRRSSLR